MRTTLSVKEPQEVPNQNGTIWVEHFPNICSEIQSTETDPNQNLIHPPHGFGSVFKNNQNPLDFSISSEELAHKLNI